MKKDLKYCLFSCTSFLISALIFLVRYLIIATYNMNYSGGRLDVLTNKVFQPVYGDLLFLLYASIILFIIGVVLARLSLENRN
ncbi:hypothetical protein [Eggerthia catenaformis]|uniref:hypothetical protein n=1 Tax=Eggerthia catenaformis TaxID=31973 RepID=UPI000478C131|nr:hypothetical protein [Eggerthia catenaformis]